MGPTVRGFRIQTEVDNTLYLVCVITRGSSYSEDVNQFSDDDDDNRVNFDGDDDAYGGEDEEAYYDDNQFYVLPLERRRKRDAVDDAEEFGREDGDDGHFGFTDLFPVFGVGGDEGGFSESYFLS